MIVSYFTPPISKNPMNLNIATILLQFLSMLMSYEKVILLGVKNFFFFLKMKDRKKKQLLFEFQEGSHTILVFGLDNNNNNNDNNNNKTHVFGF